MAELKIGSFKPDSSQYADLGLNKVEDIIIPQVKVETPVEPETPAQPEVIVEPKEPVNPEPVQPEVKESSLTPNIPESQPIVEPEIDDSKALKYLSEKLGKEFKTLDDLKSSENPLEKDPYLKELYDWRKKTGRPIEDFVKYQKDYDKLSDVEVAREFLQHQYPSFTKEEIEEELNSLIPSEDDLEYEAKNKSRQLKKYALQGRGVLKEFVSELGKPTQTSLSPEVQQDLELAKKVKEDYAVSKQAAEQYNKAIKSTVSSIENIKMNLSEGLDIDFIVPADSKKTLPDLINTMPHWKNSDGSFNHKAIVEDAIIIKHYKDMIKLAFEQGKNSGGEEIIKQAKNTTLGQPAPRDGSLNNKKGVIIEGYDDFIGKSNIKLKF